MSQADSIYCVQRYFAIGQQAFSCKDFRLAEKMFREAANLQPQAETLIGLGEALHWQGKHEDARMAYEQAIQVDPACAKALYNLGVMHEKNYEYDKAEAAYERAWKIQPMAEGANNIANCKRSLLKLEESEQWYRKAVEMGFGNAQLNLSLLLMLKGNYVKGLELFELRAKYADDSAYAPAREMLRLLDEAGKQ